MPEDFDDQMREEFHTAFPAIDSPPGALQDLRPDLNKARRQRRLASGLSALVALALVGVGVTAVVRSMPDNSDTDIGTVTPPPEEATTTTGSTSSTSPETTTTVREADAPPTSSPATVTGAVPTTAATPPTPTSTAPPTSTPDNSTTSTTAPSAEERTFSSDCGSVLVSINGSQVTLISVHENPGFTPEIKNAGPESVEVSFTGPDSECEVHADPEDHDSEESHEDSHDDSDGA